MSDSKPEDLNTHVIAIRAALEQMATDDDDILDAQKSKTKCAFRIGESLAQCEVHIPHGSMDSFYKKHFKAKKRTLQRYKQFYDYCAKNADKQSELLAMSLQKAMRQIATPKASTPAHLKALHRFSAAIKDLAALTAEEQAQLSAEIAAVTQFLGVTASNRTRLKAAVGHTLAARQ